mmetsp:Transcript_75411/g.130532  ORF Transcript_75411/g.130532 Transcript_75411/m.130532 type:complete len:117 (+) Transcript_75411:258-608(+)
MHSQSPVTLSELLMLLMLTNLQIRRSVLVEDVVLVLVVVVFVVLVLVDVVEVVAFEVVVVTVVVVVLVVVVVVVVVLVVVVVFGSTGLKGSIVNCSGARRPMPHRAPQWSSNSSRR